MVCSLKQLDYLFFFLFLRSVDFVLVMSDTTLHLSGRPCAIVKCKNKLLNVWIGLFMAKNVQLRFGVASVILRLLLHLSLTLVP